MIETETEPVDSPTLVDGREGAQWRELKLSKCAYCKYSVCMKIFVYSYV